MTKMELIDKIEHEIAFQKGQAKEFGSGVFKDDVLFARYDSAVKILESVLVWVKNTSMEG